MRKYNLNLQDQIQIDNVTQRTISIIGGKGTGKTTTLKLILDASPVPVIVFDPIGTLKHPPAMRIKVYPHHIEKASEAAQKITQITTTLRSLPQKNRKRKRVIISFQKMLQAEINAFMDRFLPKLTIRDALIAFDEAHEFIPQSGFKSTETERYIRFCRNYNVGVILTSQRPATVAKNVLALTDYLILYRLTWSHDIRAIRELLATMKPEREVNAILRKLQTQVYLEGMKIDFTK